MTFYRRNLPHILPDGANYFVTFRLSGTIPLAKLEEIRKKYESIRLDLDDAEDYILFPKNKYIYQEQMNIFYKYDAILDKCESGRKWLANEDVAKVVVEKIRSYDKVRYDLISYCVMSNHVHLLIKQYSMPAKKTSSGASKNYDLTESLRFIKGGSAREANKILGRTGEFWQHESFDHYVRNEEELLHVINYIEQNPVKAGLVKEVKDWKWTYTVRDLKVALH
jgi:putative transposase